MDVANPVVKLCGEGMAAEAAGKPGDALALFTQAWEARQDDFDACVAAHYVARHMATPEERLYWNQLSLRHANLVAGDRVAAFYPSLYLNICQSYEELENPTEAKRYLALAEEKLHLLPEDGYGAMLRRGIAAASERLA